MKNFRFNFSVLVIILLILVNIVCLGGLIFNVYNLISYIKSSSDKIINSCIFTILNLAIFSFALSISLLSKYHIHEKGISLNFGFYKITYKFDEILSLTLFKKEQKLVLYFKDSKYTLIVINSNYFDNFIKKMREIAPEIPFSQTQE
jgi:hypothetical protein